jgi:hypothetical protein
MSSPAHEGGSYSGLPNLQVSATNGIDYAYRDTSPRVDKPLASAQ